MTACQGAFIFAGQKCLAAGLSWHLSLFGLLTYGAVSGWTAEAVVQAPLPAMVARTCAGAVAVGPALLALAPGPSSGCSLVLDLVPVAG